MKKIKLNESQLNNLVENENDVAKMLLGPDYIENNPVYQHFLNQKKENMIFDEEDDDEQGHLLKRLSLIHCIFLPPLSKIRCCMEIQKTLNNQSYLENEEWNWRNQPI